MDPEVYKLILNVREVTERSKTLTFVNCRIKFNQMSQSSFVPFRQSLIFSFTPQDKNKTVEFRFDKDYREFGRLALKLDSQYLTNRFEIEKWFDLEPVEKAHKMSAKISLTIMRYTMESSRSRPTLKYNNLVETKPIEGSPRLSYLTNRLSNYVKGGTSRTPYEEHYYQTSPHQSLLENNSHQAEYMSCPNPSVSSRNLDLKLNLNLHNAVKNYEHEVSPPKEQYKSSFKGRELKPEPQQPKMLGEPLTYREREQHDKKPASRKTKSLEKPIHLYGIEKEYKASKFELPSHIEDSSRPTSYRRSIVVEDDHKDSKSSIRKYESNSAREKDQKGKDGSEKYLEQILKEGNAKMRNENRKFEHLIWDMERTRDKFESETRRNSEKVDFYADKCAGLERELLYTQNQLALWKSKAEIIKLLENELEGLRRILKERDRNIDIERAINKKRAEFEKALRDLQEENIKYREKLERLENELGESSRKNHILRQEREKTTSENIMLKARIAALEVNEEQLRHLNMQKEEIFEEIDVLRTTNRQLRELIMDQKSALWQTHEQDDHKFNDSINKLKSKVESVSHHTLAHLQTVHNYLASNFDLKNNLEKLEVLYNLDDASDIDDHELSVEHKKSVSIEAELERNLDMIQTFTDNNKRLEKHLHDAKTLKRESLSTGKFKSADFQSSGVGSLKTNFSSTNLTKSRGEKPEDPNKKQVYIPIKDDPIDARLSDFINSHPDFRKLAALFKRKVPSVYMFGSRRICLKLEHGRLYVKTGQSYLTMDSYVSLHLDLEHERMLSESIKLKKSKDK